MRRMFRLLVLLCVLCLPWSCPAAEKPNIIFILADDLGIPGVGCYGRTSKTPNLGHAVVLKQPPSVITPVTK